MSTQKNDILVKIDDEQLPKLVALYEKNAAWAPYMISLLRSIIRWKKSKDYSDALFITSPKNSWEQDGTIVMITKTHSQDVFVFTFDDHCKNLYQGLMETNLLDYTRRIFFFDVHEKFISTVMKYISEKNIEDFLTIPCYRYVLPPEESRKLTVECPPDVLLKKLETSDAKIVSQLWPHKYPGAEQGLGDYISICGGWGVFTKSTNELAAWILRHIYGHLIVVQTVQEHRRKGYGSMLFKVLAREVGEEDHWAVATVVLKNQAAIDLFEKLGFRRMCRSTYVEILKR